MKTTLRIFDKEKDYGEFWAWCAGHGKYHPQKDVLPRLGVVASVDGMDTAMAWLYMDNSCGMAMLAWATGNPQAGKSAVHVGLSAITQYLCAEAKALGYGCIMALGRGGMCKLLGRHDFHENHEVKQLFRRI